MLIKMSSFGGKLVLVLPNLILKNKFNEAASIRRVEYFTTTVIIMYPNLNFSEVDNNTLDYFNTSFLYPNELHINSNKISSGDVLSTKEIARLLQIFIRPVLFVLGTYGNAVSFYIMRRGSLREVSTCFYMAMLAIADTGELKSLPSAYIVRGKVIFILGNVCLFTIGGEVPRSRSGWGVSHPRSRWGYPIPGLSGGYPIQSLGGGTLSQVWVGNPVPGLGRGIHPRSGWGYPGVPPTMTGWCTLHHDWMGTPTRLDGILPTMTGWGTPHH